MKTTIAFFVLMLSSALVYAQDQSRVLKEAEVKVVPPQFMGMPYVAETKMEGFLGSVQDYLRKNVVYPEYDVKNKTEGTAIVQFKVQPTGKLTDFKVINHLSYNIDEELIKVLKASEGMWKPGTNNGEPVCMLKEVSMVFKFGADEKNAFSRDFTKIAGNYFTKGCDRFLVRQKPQRALKYFNNGIIYMPYDNSLLLMRGLCRYALGREEEARQDWMRIHLEGFEMETFITQHQISELPGFSAMAEIIGSDK